MNEHVSAPTRRKADGNPDPKALRILAKSIFKELRAQGYEPQQILGLATEIVSLVTSGLSGENEAPK